jgi:dihydropteroate synthase
MATYQHASYGGDVAGEVLAELGESVRLAEGAGVERSRIALDPGVGFSKRSEHSLAVLAAIPRFVALGYPLVVGASRKRFIGELTGVSNPAERVEGTIGANVMALALGARIFRVPAGRAARRALDVGWAILQSGSEE